MKGVPLANDIVSAAETEILFLDVSWALDFSLELAENTRSARESLKIKLIQKLYRISSARNRFLTKKLRYLSVERSAMSAELSRMRADGLIEFKEN